MMKRITEKLSAARESQLRSELQGSEQFQEFSFSGPLKMFTLLNTIQAEVAHSTAITVSAE